MLLLSLLLLGGVVWGGIWLGGEHRRIWVCAHHLRILGQAFGDYAQANGGSLPPAVLEDGKTSTSWDLEIAPYLEPGLAKSNSVDQQKELKAKIAYLFKCPSDRELRGDATPRSYSMPMYDISKCGWPPDESCLGGLGLYLDPNTLETVRVASATESADIIPAIKTSMVPAPTDTALLVEYVSILNALWQPKLAYISSSAEQFDAKTFEAKDFHMGRMNYLMLDGHVELMTPSQSAGFLGGVWTMRQGD